MPADPKAKASENEGSVDKGEGKGKELLEEPGDVEMDKEVPEDPKGTEEEQKDIEMK